MIQRSTPFEGEAEVVLVEDGAEQADCEGRDVRGKVVLTRDEVRRLYELAVEQHGAVGILSDRMATVPPVRPAGDLPDVRQYTSFWWRPGDRKCFGFVLTPRPGQRLRELLKQPGTAAHVRARVASRLYDGAIEVVSACVPGTQGQEEVVVVAHLCDPRPSANDNASGAAAMEAIRALRTLTARGELPRPRRTIRFLWLPEMTGTAAYLAAREGELDRMVAGLNLDMVGEDQGQTGSSWLIERPPDEAASFAPELLARLRQQFLEMRGVPDVSPSTSADTPDRSDPRSLAGSAVLAAAGVGEAAELGYGMVARFKARLVGTAQEVVSRSLELESGEALAQAMKDLDRRLAYRLDRQVAALDTLRRLAPLDCLESSLRVEAGRAARQELAWVRGALEVRAVRLGLPGLSARPELAPPPRTAAEDEAAHLVPVRQVRRPIPLSECVGRLDEEEREAWRKLERKGDHSAYTLTSLALYWADGSRSVLDIADQVQLETGTRDVELVAGYFRVLERLGLVAYRTDGHRLSCAGQAQADAARHERWR